MASMGPHRAPVAADARRAQGCPRPSPLSARQGLLSRRPLRRVLLSLTPSYTPALGRPSSVRQDPGSNLSVPREDYVQLRYRKSADGARRPAALLPPARTPLRTPPPGRSSAPPRRRARVPWRAGVPLRPSLPLRLRSLSALLLAAGLGAEQMYRLTNGTARALAAEPALLGALVQEAGEVWVSKAQLQQARAPRARARALAAAAPPRGRGVALRCLGAASPLLTPPRTAAWVGAGLGPAQGAGARRHLQLRRGGLR